MDISTSSGDFRVTDEHRPTEENDYRARVLFLTAGLGILCSKILKEYMDHCDKAVVDSGNHKVQPNMTMEDYSAAVKELLAVSIWLTLFEQANHPIPDWFKRFVLDCQTVADKVQPKPTTEEINKKYNLNSPLIELCTEVSINICNQLNLGATANDAMIYISELLTNTKDDRRQLLQFGLTQPVAALDARIKQG